MSVFFKDVCLPQKVVENSNGGSEAIEVTGIKW